MSDFGQGDRASAILEFRKARRQANLEALLAKLSGKHGDLLSFEVVKNRLSLTNSGKRYLADIPIDSIIGSVGRYYEFNRSFKPLTDGDENRWARIRQLVESPEGLPPVEVYKVGDVYFVLDGNHRVSVARQIGSPQIEAYVNEFRSKVTLTPEDDIKDVILKAEYAEMMDVTLLDQVCPDCDFILTIPGRYKEIYEHISVHRYYIGMEREREISMQEASTSWVENVYMPVVKVINELNILEDFPGRTETDLYLWLLKHQWELRETLGEEVDTGEAAQDLTERFSRRPGKILERFLGRLLKFFARKNPKS
jgi:hypothetical protein